jgi:hypothetical protein
VALRCLLALAAALLVIAVPADAKRKTARFEVVSVKGEQTATWSQTLEGGCNPTESGKQTIAFQSTRRARIKLRQIGSGRFKGAIGNAEIPTTWTFTREFNRTCPAEPAFDCGKQGPLSVPMSVVYSSGELSRRRELSVSGVAHDGPGYRTCEYSGYHEVDLLDNFGRLSEKTVFKRRRKRIHVKLSAHRTEKLADTGGAQTTDLHASVTLRRIR